ncbi:polysaccharide biosynthesis/export family protein [Acidithiobacillus sp. HP-6]|uniref:polysaccharide biosynthesis/export family protein n=1 Tax=unclassified Acidithiobacillus TaxID=2614800 RepID=UPI001879F841|nr:MULTISPECIES: polysaccharide biosynthesis/export family protein [unclassified Acidithiobacillus]MBE7562172.1 polysaccharide biosynthesis/export family protein [Acidithiobacillus sp. HP-6]MBE7570542.1 polysaccharide biosynthesis/export family protein [Acidithiobacillus sp. HP-2]
MDFAYYLYSFPGDQMIKDLLESTIKPASAILVAVSALSGCAFLPSGGPSDSQIHAQTKHNNVRLITVSPKFARTLWRKELEDRKLKAIREIDPLKKRLETVAVRLMPGDVVRVTFWTMPVQTGLGSGGGSDHNPRKENMGQYTLNETGFVNLPYIGKAEIGGLSTTDADNRLDFLVEGLRRFQSPEIRVHMIKNRGQHVVVTGSAAKPTILNWQNAGITLAEAITRAGGYRSTGRDYGHSLQANEVVVVQNGKPHTLSIRAALMHHVPLAPGDRVILTHRTLVRANCLGPGLTQSGLLSFGFTPTLAQTLAKAGGIGPTAQGRSVYVLSPSHKVIYRFAWDHVSGLRAAQQFPIQNGSVIYVANAPSVRLQQITSILFSAAYPIGIAKGL